jgi:hypothetical protein
MSVLLEILQNGQRAAERASMTGPSPNRIIKILLAQGGLMIDGHDTRKGGGIRYGKQTHVPWTYIVGGGPLALVRAVNDMRAYLDQKTGLILV